MGALVVMTLTNPPHQRSPFSNCNTTYRAERNEKLEIFVNDTKQIETT